MRRIVGVLAFLLSGPALAQPAPLPAPAEGVPPNASSPDPSAAMAADDFLRAIDAADRFSHQSSQLALTNAKGPQVLAHARSIVDGAAPFSRGLRSVDPQRYDVAVRVPGPGITDYNGGINALVTTQSDSFDGAYVAAQRDVQARLRALLEGFAVRGIRSPGIGERVAQRLREKSRALLPLAEKAIASARALPTP